MIAGRKTPRSEFKITNVYVTYLYWERWLDDAFVTVCNVYYGAKILIFGHCESKASVAFDTKCDGIIRDDSITNLLLNFRVKIFRKSSSVLWSKVKEYNDTFQFTTANIPVFAPPYEWNINLKVTTTITA